MNVVNLKQDDLDLIDEALDVLQDLEEDERDRIIDSDQTPDTIESFLGCVNTQQEKVDRIKALRRRFGVVVV